MQSLLKFANEVPKQIALNRTMQSQTKACSWKSSWLNKTENGAWLKLTNTFFFLWGSVTIIQFF